MKVQEIIIHCSATKEGTDFKAKDIDRWHKQRGFKKIGYHYVIDLDGTIEQGRKETENGAHTVGHNSIALGICYIGGLDKNGKPKDTRTLPQKAAMKVLVDTLRAEYGNCPVYGHNQFDNKACPCFDAFNEYNLVDDNDEGDAE